MEAITKYDMSSTEGSVSLPPGRTIRLSLREVKELCVDRFPDDEKEDFKEFIQLLERVIRHEVGDLVRDVESSYAMLSPAEHGVRLRKELLQAGKEASIRKYEMRFVRQFCQIMSLSDFSAVSAGEWDMATEDAFVFTLPVDIEWDCYDPDFLSPFLAAYPQFKEHVPSFSNRIMVFRQGSSVVTMKQWMFAQKVEHLVYLIFFSPILSLLTWFARLFIPKRKPQHTPRAPPVQKDAATADKDTQDPLLKVPQPDPNTDHPLTSSSAKQDSQKSLKAEPTPAKKRGFMSGLRGMAKSVGRLPGRGSAKSQATAHVAHHCALMDRQNFRKALPTVWATLTNLHKKVELREPAFKNVAILYRNSLKGEQEAERDPEIKAKPQAVHIKIFHNIPLADLEVVFPFKRVRFKYLDQLICIVSIIGAVYLVVTQLQSGNAPSQMLQGIVGVVVAKAVQTFNTMKTAKFEMEKDMQRTFVHKSKDSDEGALYYLLQSSESQEVKEVLLAYTFCLVYNERNVILRDSGVDIQNLTKAVDAALQERSHEMMNFDVNVAVKKLQHHHLLAETDGNLLFPVPLSEGLSIMRSKLNATLPANKKK